MDQDQRQHAQRACETRFARAWAEHQAVEAEWACPSDLQRPLLPETLDALFARLNARAQWQAQPRRPAVRRAVESPSGGYVMLLRFVGAAPVAPARTG